MRLRRLDTTTTRPLAIQLVTTTRLVTTIRLASTAHLGSIALLVRRTTPALRTIRVLRTIRGLRTRVLPALVSRPIISPSYTNNQTGVPYRNDPPSVLLADQRAGVPSTSSSNVVSGGRSSWGTRTDGYPSDSLNDYNNQLAPRTGMENIMPVMFVLSLVVNFYLGMLIRKLLGRYRTLLSSVRSQTI